MPGEGLAFVLGKLRKDIFQNRCSLLQNIIVPIAGDGKARVSKCCIAHDIALVECVLTSINFDNELFIETDKINDVIYKRNLSPKLERGKATISKQLPHGCFGVGRRAAHLFFAKPRLGFEMD